MKDQASNVAKAFSVQVDSEILRRIRQHARSSMSAEICGILIGSKKEDTVVVEACIPGEKAAQGGAHVTFTQDTWAHIYKVKDKDYPDKSVVGWYHSHPGFGVFLSDHDLFIHENFFSARHQVAWVYDPHSDEEGCFGWENGRTRRLKRISVFSQPKDDVDTIRREPLPSFGGTTSSGEPKKRTEPEARNAASRTHTLFLILAVLLGVAWLICRGMPFVKLSLLSKWALWIDACVGFVLFLAGVFWLRTNRSVSQRNKVPSPVTAPTNISLSKSETNNPKSGL